MRGTSGKRTLIALASVALVLGVAACDRPSASEATVSSSPKPTTAVSTAVSPAQPSSTAVPTTPPAQAAPSACADLDGTVEPGQTCHVHSATTDYTLDFRFPIDYPDQQAIKEFLTKERDGFIELTSEQSMQGRTHPYELGITGKPYRSGTPAPGTESVLFTVYYDTGNHPVTSYQSFNYDLGERVPITLETLFKPGTQAVEVLDPIAQRAMEERWAGNGGPVPTNNLGAKVYQNFAITDDAVIFFIGQGMWLPEAAGPVEVSVPRTEIESILA